MTETKVPPLPAVAVDFNALNDALSSGDSPALARANAIGKAAGRELSDRESLSGKPKSELLKLARREKVAVADDATNDEIAAGIEAGRIRWLETGIEPADLPAPAADAPRASTPPEAPADSGDDAA